MPFCTSCGAEIAAGKKFCTQCGAPMPVVEPSSPTASADPGTPAAPDAPLPPPFSPGIRAPPEKPVIPKNPVIIGVIIALIVIMVVVYFVGLPMLKSAGERTVDGMIPTPTVPPATPAPLPTETPEPLLLNATPELTIVPETPALPVQERDMRLEEDYEPIYSLNQNFSFGQKVNFAHVLTRPPLYVQFNLTPVTITRHRLVSAMTNNEHYENTTEASPYAWFEVKVVDVETGDVVEQQGFGKDYPDLTKHSFMVRVRGNYRIEMSGNDVNADVRMLIGTP